MISLFHALVVALAGSRKFPFSFSFFVIHHVYPIVGSLIFIFEQHNHETEVYVSDLSWDLHFHRSGIMLRCFILEIIISKTRGNVLASQRLLLL
jgi:hypothetical protein